MAPDSQEFDPVLEVRDLSVRFDLARGSYPAVDGVDLTLYRGETLAVVGESGCGKTVMSLALLRLVSEPGRIAGGRVLFEGRDLLALPESEMRALRGGRISMIFQEPMTALNPVLTVGEQVAEVFRLHKRVGQAEALRLSAEMLGRVGIPEPESRLSSYPMELSGGLRQRVVIAMALACDPDVVLADEPTTALDVTIQAQILELLRALREKSRASVLLITHDMGVVAQVADRVAVMYAGRVVEEGEVFALFREPAHPYTRALLKSIPSLPGGTGGDEAPARLEAIPGTAPALGAIPAGCPFHPRCAYAFDRCRVGRPELYSVEGDSDPARPRRARCYLHA